MKTYSSLLQTKIDIQKIIRRIGHNTKLYLTCYDDQGNEKIIEYTRNDIPALKAKVKEIDHQMEEIYAEIDRQVKKVVDAEGQLKAVLNTLRIDI